MPVVSLAKLAGIPNSRIAAALKDRDGKFTLQDEGILLPLTQRLVEIFDALDPLRLDMSDAAQLRYLLDRMEKTGVTAEDIRIGIARIFDK